MVSINSTKTLLRNCPGLFTDSIITDLFGSFKEGHNRIACSKRVTNAELIFEVAIKKVGVQSDFGNDVHFIHRWCGATADFLKRDRKRLCAAE